MSEQVTHVFNMEMTCGGCTGAAERVLGKLGDKVSGVKADLDSKTVTVTSALPSEELLQQLNKTGKTVTYVGPKKDE